MTRKPRCQARGCDNPTWASWSLFCNGHSDSLSAWADGGEKRLRQECRRLGIPMPYEFHMMLYRPWKAHGETALIETGSPPQAYPPVARQWHRRLGSKIAKAWDAWVAAVEPTGLVVFKDEPNRPLAFAQPAGAVDRLAAIEAQLAQIDGTLAKILSLMQASQPG